MTFWRLVDFEDRLDDWIELDEPSTDLRVIVTEWVIGRFDDPYIEMRRLPDVAVNYWFGVVPGTRVGNSAVTCGYFIDEQTRTVRCDSIATLALPL